MSELKTVKFACFPSRMLAFRQLVHLATRSPSASLGRLGRIARTVPVNAKSQALGHSLLQQARRPETKWACERD